LRNRLVKECLVSHVLWEPQTKMTISCTTLLGWRKFRMPRTLITEDVEQREPSFIADGNAKWLSYFRRQFGSFL
jgi:hypothetical protein